MSLQVHHPALRYYGGKFRLAHKIAPHFPDHQCYVELFGGAAGVLLRKEPSALEVYNDINGRLVNFFRQCRDNSSALIRALRRTPFAREEFLDSYHPSDDPLEDARRYAVLAWQGFGGPRTKKLTGWRSQRRLWDDNRANQVGDWLRLPRTLVAIRRRLALVQIEQDPWHKVLARYDSPHALFYVDPPYPSDTRNAGWCKRAYDHEFTALDHRELAGALRRIQGRAVVSCYPNTDYETFFEGWERVEFRAQTMNRTTATEVLWISPEKN